MIRNEIKDAMSKCGAARGGTGGAGVGCAIGRLWHGPDVSENGGRRDAIRISSAILTEIASLGGADASNRDSRVPQPGGGGGRRTVVAASAVASQPTMCHIVGMVIEGRIRHVPCAQPAQSGRFNATAALNRRSLERR